MLSKIRVRHPNSKIKMGLTVLGLDGLDVQDYDGHIADCQSICQQFADAR